MLQDAAVFLENKTGQKVRPVQADTTDWNSLQKLAKTTADTLKNIHILVNCAASHAGSVHNELEHADVGSLKSDLNTKTLGYFRCCKVVVPYMKAQRWGRIINIGGLTVRTSDTLSGMRNVAISHMTNTPADQLGPDGITINQIRPGLVRTQHVEELFATQGRERGTTAEEIERQWCSDTPIRRMLEPKEIGDFVAFLASPLAGGITGQSIAIDGGLTRGIYV